MSSLSSGSGYVSRAFSFSMPSESYCRFENGSRMRVGVCGDSDNKVYFQSLGHDMTTAMFQTGFAVYAGSYGADLALPVPVTTINVTSSEISVIFGKSVANNNGAWIYFDLFLWADPSILGNCFSLFNASDNGADVFWNWGHGESGLDMLSTQESNGTRIEWN